MTRAILLFVFSRLLVLLYGGRGFESRRRAAAPPSPASAQPDVAQWLERRDRSTEARGRRPRVEVTRERGQRLPTTRCACLLRELFRQWAVDWTSFLPSHTDRFIFSEESDRLRRRWLDIVAGRAFPNEAEKLAIVDVLGRVRPASTKPRLGYEEIFGPQARKPKNCTCELRRLLDSSGVTVRMVAAELGAEPKTVTAWRTGTAAPTAEQLEQVRRLAARQNVQVIYRGEPRGEELPS